MNIDTLCDELESSSQAISEGFALHERLQIATESFRAIGKESASPQIVGLYLANFVDISPEILPEVNSMAVEKMNSDDVTERYAFALESGEGVLETLKKMLIAAFDFIVNLLKRIGNFITGRKTVVDSIENTARRKNVNEFSDVMVPAKPSYAVLAVNGRLDDHSISALSRELERIHTDIGSAAKHMFPALRTERDYTEILKAAHNNDVAGYRKEANRTAEDPWNWLKKAELVLIPGNDTGGCKVTYDESQGYKLEESAASNNTQYSDFNGKRFNHFAASAQYFVSTCRVTSSYMEQGLTQLEKILRSVPKGDDATPEGIRSIKALANYYTRITSLVSHKTIRYTMHVVDALTDINKHILSESAKNKAQ